MVAEGKLDDLLYCPLQHRVIVESYKADVTTTFQSPTLEFPN